MDVTKRKHIEEALHASEIRYRRLFETSQDGILILDLNTGQILDVNRYLIDMLGISRGVSGEKTLGDRSFQRNFPEQDAFCRTARKGLCPLRIYTP